MVISTYARYIFQYNVFILYRSYYHILSKFLNEASRLYLKSFILIS